MSEETGAMSEKALHILRAAVKDAGGEPGVYVSRARVMEQSGLSDLEDFERAAGELAERSFIDKGVTRYEFIVITLKGIGAGATGAAEAPEPASEGRIGLDRSTPAATRALTVRAQLVASVLRDGVTKGDTTRGNQHRLQVPCTWRSKGG